jgi:O-methyltransferase
MNEERWSEVDTFISERLGLTDAALEACLRDAEAAGLPAIQVSPPQGRLLQMLVRMQGARRVLEFGTLGGYSSIWIARALPGDGSLISLEASPEYAAVARASIDRAGVGERVEIRVGPGHAARTRGRRRRPLRPHLHRRRQGQHPELLRLGPRPLPPWRPDRRRQRRPRRHPRRSRQRGPCDAGAAPLPRRSGGGAAGAGDDDSDGRHQGVRRVHVGVGEGRVIREVVGRGYRYPTRRRNSKDCWASDPSNPSSFQPGCAGFASPSYGAIAPQIGARPKRPRINRIGIGPPAATFPQRGTGIPAAARPELRRLAGPEQL